MIENVLDLESKLKIAKEKEFIDNLIKLLESLNVYEGKCYSTHRLSRYFKNPRIEFSMIRISNIRLNKENTNVIFDYENLRYSKNLDKVGSFDLNFYESQNFDGNRIMFGRDSLNYQYRKHNEIDSELYHKIKEKVVNKINNIIDEVRKEIKQTDEITMGYHSDSEIQFNLLKETNLDLLDVSELPLSPNKMSYKELLTWARHPLYIGNRYLIKSEDSIKILEKIAKDYVKKAQGYIYASGEQDYKRAQDYTSLINFIRK